MSSSKKATKKASKKHAKKASTKKAKKPVSKKAPAPDRAHRAKPLPKNPKQPTLRDLGITIGMDDYVPENDLEYWSVENVRQFIFEQEERARNEQGPTDNVDYYGGTACAEAIESFGIAREGYMTVVFMYLWRAGKKPGSSAERDLKKAQWYLERLAKIHPDVLDAEDGLFTQLCSDLEEIAAEHGIELEEAAS